MSKQPREYEDAVRRALAHFLDPETGRAVTETGQFQGVRIEEDRLVATVGLTPWSAAITEQLRGEMQALIAEQLPDVPVEIELTRHIRELAPLGGTNLRARSVIAVGSGKGGVGKSSIAAALALGLRRAGSRVGLLDADLYGPSIPHLLGLSDQPVMANERIQPPQADGMPVLSIGLLVPPGEAVIWRGPMLHSALTQFLSDADWGELDWLVIDMPPGTGDVPISLVQLIPLTGAVVVCTPQDVALLDARKAIAMFEKVDLPVLGIVENMSGFVCSQCGTRHDIFGAGGAKAAAEQLQLPLLAEVPLESRLRELADEGRVAEAFDLPAAGPPLDGMVRNLVGALADSNRRHPPKAELPVIG